MLSKVVEGGYESKKCDRHIVALGDRVKKNTNIYIHTHTHIPETGVRKQRQGGLMMATPLEEKMGKGQQSRGAVDKKLASVSMMAEPQRTEAFHRFQVVSLRLDKSYVTV